MIADLLGQLGPAGDALAELFGLRPPTGHPAVPTLDLAAFLGDPLAAVRAHWRTLVTDHADAVPALLTHVRDLLADAARGADPVTGSGTGEDPWLVPVVGPVALNVHRDEAGLLHVAVAARYVVETLGQGCTTVTTQVAVDLVVVDLDAGTASFLAGVVASLTARARRADEARIDLGDVMIVARHVGLAARWAPATGLRIGLDAPGLAVRSELGEVPIVLPTLGPGGRLTLDSAGWTSLEALAGLLIAHGGRLVGELARSPVPWLADLLGALGWTGTGGPRLSLEALAADAHAALANWLAQLLAAGSDALDSLVQAIGRALAGSATAFGRISGTGRPDDPWLVHLDALPGRPALAAWVLPDGPTRPATFVPDELKGWQPGLPGIGVDLLADALHADTSLSAVTRGLVTGRSRNDIVAGLAALRDRWVASDGLIVPPSSDPAGFSVHRRADLTAAELRAAVDLPGLLGTDPDTVVRVAVRRADDADPWPGAPPARIVDLRTAGLSPDAFALPTAATGEWFVALGDRDAARLAAGDADGTVGQAARLVRILGPFAALPGQLALVAEGGAGHAARLAADAVAEVDAVVTLGTPLGPVAFTVLDAAPGADALRLLTALLPPEDPAEPDDADLARARRLCGGLLELTGLADLARDLQPPVDGIAPPRAGLPSQAVFGVLGPDAVARAMTAAVSADLSVRAQARFEATVVAGAAAPATGVRVGVRLPVAATAADVVVDGHALVELAGVDLVGAGEGGPAGPSLSRTRSLRTHLELRRAGGWLVGGPDPTLAGARPEHELRWLEADVVLPLGGSSPPAAATIVLHEPTTFGVRRPRWVVQPSAAAAAASAVAAAGPGSDVATPALPEVRVLLSLVAAELEELAGLAGPGGPAPAVVELLEGLGVLAAGGGVPDAVDHLLHDPAAHVATSLADPLARAVLQSALDSLLGAVGGVSVDLATRTAAVTWSSTAGLAAWNLAATVAATGSASATLTVGGAGATAAGGLELRLDSAAGRVDLVVHRPGTASLTLPLWPTFDGGALLALLADLVPAELGRLGLEHLRRLDPGARPMVDAIYEAIGLLGALSPTTAERPVLLPVGLLRDPVAWLAHASSFGAAAAGATFSTPPGWPPSSMR